jgi:transposase InsO family protein
LPFKSETPLVTRKAAPLLAFWPTPFKLTGQYWLRRPIESAQYVGIRYTERLAEAGIEPSVGSVGDSYDNALAETINGLYKAEVIHRRGPWRSFETVEFATLTWVDWFNNRRLLHWPTYKNNSGALIAAE